MKYLVNTYITDTTENFRNKSDFTLDLMTNCCKLMTTKDEFVLVSCVTEGNDEVTMQLHLPNYMVDELATVFMNYSRILAERKDKK